MDLGFEIGHMQILDRNVNILNNIRLLFYPPQLTP